MRWMAPGLCHGLSAHMAARTEVLLVPAACCPRRSCPLPLVLERRCVQYAGIAPTGGVWGPYALLGLGLGSWALWAMDPLDRDRDHERKPQQASDCSPLPHHASYPMPVRAILQSPHRSRTPAQHSEAIAVGYPCDTNRYITQTRHKFWRLAVRGCYQMCTPAVGPADGWMLPQLSIYRDAVAAQVYQQD
jgi:hypothetical protein